MWPLLIVSQVMGGMRPASAASEAIEAEVSLGARNFVYSIFVHFLLYTVFMKEDFCTRF